MIDTGMGFERLYDRQERLRITIPIFFNRSFKDRELSGARYGEDPEKDVAMRVVADHVRALLSPLPMGSYLQYRCGYVICRILRRCSVWLYLWNEEPLYTNLSLHLLK